MDFSNLERAIEMSIPDGEFFLLDEASNALFKKDCKMYYIDFCLDKFNEYYNGNGEPYLSKYKAIEDTVRHMCVNYDRLARYKTG